MIPTRLPLTDEDLRSFVEALDLSRDEVPFWDDEGAWDGEALWLGQRWDRRFDWWREDADLRYEGLEDEPVARELLGQGLFPVALAGEPRDAHELFADASGNVALLVPGARTVEGTEPVFFFDHDRRDVLKLVARSLPELQARRALEVWARKHPDVDVQPLLDAPIALDPASLSTAAGPLRDGWRRALGLPARDEPPPEPAGPRREPVATGVTLAGSTSVPSHAKPAVRAFQDAYNTKFVLARALAPEALEDLARPFLWWEQPFDDLQFAMRNAMARLLAVLSLHQGKAGRYGTRQLMAGVDLLDGIVQRGTIEVAPNEDPLDVLRAAADLAHRLLDGEPVLPRVPPMHEFHEGWRGIVPDAELDRADADALEGLSSLCSALVQTKNAAYNLVRKCGDDHVDGIGALLPRLLAADQLYFLHGLDAFPKHPGVIALYERVLADTPHEDVRTKTRAYLERVRSGRRTTGWEG